MTADDIARLIPDAVVEAAVDMIDTLLAQDVSDTRILSVCAIAAALAAWPGAVGCDEYLEFIHLPLPQEPKEPSNDR